MGHTQAGHVTPTHRGGMSVGRDAPHLNDREYRLAVVRRAGDNENCRHYNECLRRAIKAAESAFARKDARGQYERLAFGCNSSDA
jgi:hypothetical protein